MSAYSRYDFPLSCPSYPGTSFFYAGIFRCYNVGQSEVDRMRNASVDYHVALIFVGIRYGPIVGLGPGAEIAVFSVGSD